MHHNPAVFERPPARRCSTGALAIIASLLVPGLSSGIAPASAFEAPQAGALPPNIRSVFSPDQTNQYVMTVEAAMARAQAAHGAIPKTAADEITRKADVKYVPREELEKERAIVQHRMVALLNVWRRQMEPDARQFLHFGATTVDIYDTALTLQLLRSTQLIVDDLRDIEEILIGLARSGKEAVMAGRTLGQHALPITFGKKVSTWIGENRRNIERIKALRAELRRCAILKGAVGTYAGLGDRANEIEKTFAKELGLAQPYPDDWHGTRDVFASYALTLSLISKSFARIGQEIFLLQMTDIGEAAEPRDPTSISSSSLAQKTNPSKSEALIHAGRVIPRLAEVILDDVVNVFERDNTSAPTVVIEDLSIRTETNLEAAKLLLSRLDINRGRMRDNLGRSKGLIMAQRVVFALAAQIGMEEADKRIHEIVREMAQSDADFRSALLADAEVSKVLSPADIDKLLQPQGYTGLSGQQVEDVISQAEALRATDKTE
jgi:adenylosuccinate lyase